ncbi:CmcI family methyltransferase [Methylobacterium haplocladii]|uniref:Uncharacterized protein n=1 Tax=Methylobacterium haplocladii TaxID=1176176 RepID=A0A512IMT2_9HYPH|nr:CmcI family methyltransferase [Methylobacterium haplocladii]GEO99014.1 hypothetical protein MHA02_14020 [Methylobacterium haplocladii]GJD84139.1 8-demethyl-8-alpha-L-rhamnosyl tetracenomycin-C 2'-O-methyltransferase [Methylobacterium haplocladii]GLS58986.1 hypothetical protein GCM10007887_16520 [Methylobacterium haplocladii]
MSDGFLHKYFLSNGHKPLLKWIHYFDIYERHFERFRNKSPVMLEIGVAHGGSVQMWKEYFGPGCKIVGVDINPDFKRHESENVEIFIGSQDEPNVIDAILQKYPRIDIVLDDGSHMMEHMTNTFNLLFHRISPTGVYMVEDTHTCYWPEFGGGLDDPKSFLEICKHKIDDMNASYTRNALPISDFTKSIHSMSFYDSIIVFEKKPQGARQMPITGPLGA